MRAVELGEPGAVELVERDDVVRELARRHTEDAVRAEGRQVELHTELPAAVLGHDAVVVEAGHERGEAPRCPFRRHLHVEHVAEADDHRDVAVRHLAPAQRQRRAFDVAGVPGDVFHEAGVRGRPGHGPRVRPGVVCVDRQPGVAHTSSIEHLAPGPDAAGLEDR